MLCFLSSNKPLWHGHLQEAGLKVKEYELLRKNFSETGNFGRSIVLLVLCPAVLLPSQPSIHR